VVILCSDESKRISNVIRKFKGQLIKAGWPVGIEIKAHNLYDAPRNRDIPDTYKYKRDSATPVELILRRLTTCEIEIDTIIVRKERINTNLRNLPNSILLNYFSGRVLIDRITKYSNVNLYVDLTNKQTHDSQHFDGYIKTGAYLTKKSFFPLNIEHVDSNVVRGISAVDFFAWSVFRKYEYGDNRFMTIFRHKISTLKRYYFREK
jgi:hypothetical protein